MYKFLNKLTTIIFSVISIVILFLIFVFNYLEYNKKLSVSNYNNYVVILGIVVFIIILMISFIFIKIKIKNILYIITFLLSVIQILVIYTYYFVTGWDAGTVIDNSFNLANQGKLDYPYYFSVFPNNVLIVKFYSEIISIVNLVGLDKYAYFILLILMVIICNSTSILLYKVLEKIFNNKIISIIGYFYYLLLIYISPWISIPYSDSLSLIIPILLLYIYIFFNKNICLKFILLTFIFVLAINIKPQTAIIYIAILIFDLIISFKLKYIIKKILIIILTFLVTTQCFELYTKDITNQLNKELATTYIHYIKMGLNENSSGEWNSEDVIFSQSIISKKDRDEANKQVIIERLSNFTTQGFIKHFAKKTLLTYNDGTFAWGKEGNFYNIILEKDNFSSDFTRNIYYEDGKYNKVFNVFQQANWLMLLVLTVFSLFINKDEKNYKLIIYLTLIGLFIFETIFEARARYLFSNVPIFIICAMYGVQNLIELKNRIFNKKN